jgi:hypothetical protein
MLKCTIIRRCYLIDLWEATQEGGHLWRVGVEHGHQGSVRSSPSAATQGTVPVTIMKTSVVDPDLDSYVFGPPGSGCGSSIKQK